MTIQKIRKILVANRSEIAIRVMRAATELGIATVAIFAKEDHLSLHRFKADESYLIGEGLGPVKAYLAIDDIIRVAKKSGADAIHPGYGFLSESPEFAERCVKEGLIFIGPSADVMRGFGDKISARNIAISAGVPVVPASSALPNHDKDIKKVAAEIGYPLMLKASWGGGGRGMRVIEDEDSLLDAVAVGRKEAGAAFGKDDVYLEKLVRRARHVEVQLIGDKHGNLVHLFERDCSVQRRHQKVVERAPAPYLDELQRRTLAELGILIGRKVGYTHAGTVEFLMDVDSGEFYFIEVNPRVQVEHTVTEEVTGIDIVKAQIRISEGFAIGDAASGVPRQSDIRLNGHALQCRVTTEDPEHGFTPDYGKIVAYRGATGFGVRLDGGTAYAGAVVTRFYDSLLEKVTVWAPNVDEAMDRMSRALREFRIRGVATNLAFLNNVVNHENFRSCNYTTSFIDQTPDLFEFKARRDRATKLLRFLADVSVNGNPEVEGRKIPRCVKTPLPPKPSAESPPSGMRDRLTSLGPTEFAAWVRSQDEVLFTDTTMRDAHQSLLATRMRSYDMVRIAPYYAENLSNLFSLECWGGATFDVAMRFLRECPWTRLNDIRTAVPNIPLQMLLRASNAVGYKNYPDNVVEHFIQRAADNGIDVFRVFDSLNWTENMFVAMDSVLSTGAVCEATICYSGDLTDPSETTYTLDYYINMARELVSHGAHILAIKDMAGVCKPAAISSLVETIRSEFTLPVHFHTHDTSGAASASVMAAIAAGCDIVDGASDAFSGLTSQPPLGSLVQALPYEGRSTSLDRKALQRAAYYWEDVREQYAAFESSNRSGTSEVYLHSMPGGQYTNLQEQARSLGIEGARWHEVAQAYADVNELFGDIVKVTPSSKVVGDMALAMVSSGLSKDDVSNPTKEVAFPDSVISFFKGELGQPPNGFPSALQNKVLKGGTAISVRPGKLLKPAEFAESRRKVRAFVGQSASENDLASYLLYPRVFKDFAKVRAEFDDLSKLPTEQFFYGLSPGREIRIDLDPGKTIIVRCLSVSEPDEDGVARVFYELNGQPRTIRVRNRRVASKTQATEKADPSVEGQIGAPMTGMVAETRVKQGDLVQAGDVLATIEAMKMEVQIIAEVPGTVERAIATPGMQVETKDLLFVIQSVLK